MKSYQKIFLAFGFWLLAFGFNKAQNLILNGSFENNLCNSGGTGVLNTVNQEYDSLMAYSYGFGTYGNIDILKIGSNFCGAAENGIWCIALTSGGTDAFSLKLSSPIIQGDLYSLSFYGRADSSYAPGVPIQIGVSNVDSLFGNLLYTSSTPINCQWQSWSFSFTAPINAQYITVTCGGSSNVDSAWVHVDNFVLDTGINAGINQILNAEQIKIYPTPANTILNINSNLRLAACSLQLYNVLGNVVKTQTLKNTNEAIDVSSVANGVYFVVVTNEQQVLSTKKIIVQH